MKHSTLLLQRIFLSMLLALSFVMARAEVTTTVDGMETRVTSTDTTGVVTLPTWTSANKGYNNTASALVVTFNVRRGTRLSFDWLISCEEKYDIAYVWLDGKELYSLTGQDSGSYECMFTKAGEHELEFLYKKDQMGSEYDDQLKISNFKLDHDAGEREGGILPFHVTTINADGTFAKDVMWYQMRGGSNKHYLYMGTDGLVHGTASAEKDSTYYWTFTRNEAGEIAIYNMAGGSTKPLTWAERTHKATITMGGEGSDSAFKITENSDGYSFYQDGDTCATYFYNNKLSVYKPTTIWKSYNTNAAARFYFEYVGTPQLSPITGIHFYEGEQTTLEEGETQYYSFYVSPSNTNETEVTYSISNTSVVKCSYFNSEYGYIGLQGVKGGDAVLTLQSVKRPEVKTELKVHVNGKVYVTAITLEQDSICLRKGTMHPIKVTVTPADAYDPTYTWTNSAPSVASISKDGTVYAWSAGTCTLTAKANDGNGAKAQLKVTVIDGETEEPVPYDRNFLYAQHTDGSLTAIPRSFIEAQTYQGTSLSLRLTGGLQHVLTDVEALTDECPVELPQFTSYKFNNKFNDQLFTDVVADASTLTADTLTLPVACIGKRLTASFQLEDTLAQVWVGDERQKSKRTRQRFDHPITYTIGHPDWHTLSLVQKGNGTTEVRTLPFGRQTTVVVDWLTEKSTNDYTVPVINITLDNDAAWSYNNWISTRSAYVGATISIQGGDVMPNLDETPIQIKGRGNSSWGSSYSSKNPYHFKFESKQKPLGMKAGKHWLLIANKQTGSMMTNAIAQRAASLLDMKYANHMVPVELYINGSYRGSYNLTERVGLGNNSVSLDNDSLAAMLELDTYTDEPIKMDYTSNMPTKLKDPDYDAEIHTQALSSFSNLTQAVLYGRDYDNLVDIDQLASFLLTNELIANCEMKHPKSVFLYNENIYDGESTEDPTPWVFGPLWDCDWAFGYQQSKSYFINSANMDYFTQMGNSDFYWDNPQRFWNTLRHGSTKLDKAIYSRLYHFITMGGLQELLEYCDDYYEFAQNSLTHNKLNATSERDATNYQTQVTSAQKWLQQRASTMFSALNVYDLSDDDDSDQHMTDPVKPTHYFTTKGQSVLYDMSGRPVTGRPAPGIYVKDGRKIMIK